MFRTTDPTDSRSITPGCRFAFGRSCIALLVTALFVSVCAAQNPAGSSSGSERVAAQTVTSLRLPVEPIRPSGIYNGSTAVEIELGLESIGRGKEPRTIEELQALERQQIKVAEKIAAVTVNILQGSAQGSGVIVSPEGFVLTAAHVAGKPGRETRITLADGRTVRGRTLGMNRSVDAGLIQITESSGIEWPHASLGLSSDLVLGQWVIAAGHPGGLVKNRPPVIRVGRLLNTLPSTLITDCTLIGGDSGGPLFDLNGKLIGIHSRIGAEFSDNMHVPIDMYRDSWERMAKSEAWGTLPGYKPVIGVLGFGSGDQAKRATIEQVVIDGPADRAGIEKGDIIIRYDGVAITTFEELIAAVDGSLPGDRVTISLIRENQVIEKRMIVGVEEP